MDIPNLAALRTAIDLRPSDNERKQPRFSFFAKGRGKELAVRTLRSNPSNASSDTESVRTGLML